MAQRLIQSSASNGLVRLHNTDWAVLELQEPRKDLPCNVTPSKPVLGFDLKFHAGYEVSVPLRDLAGSENLLTILFRVTPEQKGAQPAYFVQHIRVPPIEPDARGEAYLQGSFDLGEGRYHVDWLMRDRAERVCSAYWDVEAALSPRDRDIVVALAPATVQPSDPEPFRDEPPVRRAAEEPPLNVKVLINFAPQNSYSAVLQPLDTNALVSILRSIAREPRIGKFSIVAFNLQEQRIVYRQDGAERIDFPALGEALQTLNLGTIDIKRLGQKDAETRFLAELIRSETAAEDRPDALIFAGPKVMLPEKIQEEDLKQIGGLEYPVFYMNYNLYPQANPWRDAIGAVVKFFKGTEFTISRPRDLWHAITEMVSRIVQFKQQRASSNGVSR
ncbi:MAG: acetyltransferase [Bryobacterales bacterium]|nr:acetyltransferase [Bryobacterales bacterium]